MAFLALGGSSYAAITITGRNVRNSSLTGRDVKNNSLTGADIKGIKSGDVSDRSLLAKDFKGGQLRAGAQGEKGLKGDKGDSATKLFGYIRDFGATDTANVEYGSGVTGVTAANGDNTYRVSFNRSLVHCVVLAVPGSGDPPGDAGSVSFPDAIPSIAVAQGTDNETDVEFKHGNPAATVDTSFMVTAFC